MTTSKEKKCKNCLKNFTPKTSREKYCHLSRTKKCPTCSNEFTYQCDRNKGAACSITCHKKLKSLNNSPKECIICKEEFVPFNGRQKFCGEVKTKKCSVCEENFERICSSRTNYKYCSNSCSKKSPEVQEKTRKTMLKKYKVEVTFQAEEIQNKIKKTNLRKYGFENPIASPEIQKKAKATNLEKYGNEIAMKNKEIKEKVQATQRKNNDGKIAFNNPKQRETMIKKYGGASPMASKRVRKKVKKTQFEKNGGVFGFNNAKQKKTMFEKYGGHGRLSDPKEVGRTRESVKKLYGVDWVSKHPEFKQKALDSIIKKHGHLFGDHNPISKTNRDFAEKLEKEFHVKIEFEKSIDGKFFDLYIPEAELLIELNPTVTHNSTKAFACLVNGCEENCSKHTPTPKNYHQKKSLIAKNNGLNLIHIYEWDDEVSIRKMIRAKLKKDQRKLSSHKCLVKKIPQKTANKFLDQNHIQGSTNKQTRCYGLFKKDSDEIVAVSTFGKPRFNKNFEWEFVRYAVKENLHLYGGGAKLFKYFVNQENPKSIISYVDFNHTTRPTFLDSLHFEIERITSPDLIWFNPETKKKVKQTSVNSLGADRLLNTDYGTMKKSGLNNREILQKEGFMEVYTSGNLIYTWISKPS